jgi:DNA-binding MarR family transcriptional regulator
MPQTRTAARPVQRLPLDQRFGYRFSMIARALAQHMLLYVEREFGLNLAEYRILSTLANRDSPSIRDIAADSQIDKSHVTRALADLIERGQVTQAVDQGDRRLRVVDLTPAGRAIIAATLPFSVERQERLERCLSASELRVLWKALSVLSHEADRMLAEEEAKGSRRRLAAELPRPINSRSKRKGAG